MGVPQCQHLLKRCLRGERGMVKVRITYGTHRAALADGFHFFLGGGGGGGLASSKQQAGGAHVGPISVSRVRPSEQQPNLVGTPVQDNHSGVLLVPELPLIPGAHSIHQPACTPFSDQSCETCQVIAGNGEGNPVRRHASPDSLFLETCIHSKCFVTWRCLAGQLVTLARDTHRY